jgi:hypothetical protein
VRIISLQAGSDDLIWICDAARENLRQTGNGKKVNIAQRPLRTLVAAEKPFSVYRLGSDEFQLLISHELKGTMTDPKQRWDKTTVEARYALRVVDLVYTRRE